jgi:hypothetical protein
LDKKVANKIFCTHLYFNLYYFVLAPVDTPKNQFNKYFHTIFSPGEVSVCLSLSRLGSENSFQQSLQMEAPSGASPFQNFLFSSVTVLGGL